MLDTNLARIRFRFRLPFYPFRKLTRLNGLRLSAQQFTWPAYVQQLIIALYHFSFYLSLSHTSTLESPMHQRIIISMQKMWMVMVPSYYTSIYVPRHRWAEGRPGLNELLSLPYMSIDHATTTPLLAVSV